ncbi:DUF3802 family protein [Shewanella sp. D64]|uniref:DUF3802 family protein n=1 Tax=unclassified Shewanella TaxID=196818 RepID=UPI0022BA4E20|nr:MULTISPECIES: DUF3802 family protein [unclassified Shewanella]MEC4724896.1 DUF3802 family protein [Shewanella sp. D64]MEC4736311.1 DUF3802 family protein [Shewanella sp. E94]WBJ97627.1 DUF3802 family protein [Shewanella sp. MTB7]
MVTDKEGYMHLVQYLTEHLSLFEDKSNESLTNDTVLELFEAQLAAQIIMVCGQNPSLNFAQRNKVIREVDAIVYDLEEILGFVANQKVTPEQISFITEFSGLIKNLFDHEIAILLA